MFTKLLTTLTADEMGKVYDANSKLQHEVYDRICDDNMFWIGEILDCFRENLCDWSIGYGIYNKVQFYDVETSEWENMLDGLLKACHDYGFFPEDETETIKQIAAKTERLRFMDYDNKQYGNLYRHLEKCAEIVRSMILRNFDQYMEIGTDYPRQYFCEYGKDQFPDDCYIDEDFILYELQIIKYA